MLRSNRNSSPKLEYEDLTRKACGSFTVVEEMSFSVEADWVALPSVRLRMTRRPVLVRGLYLGKTPVQYQKTTPKFPFFHETSKNDGEEEDAKMRPCRREMSYPGCLVVRTCNLQMREVKHNVVERRIPSARTTSNGLFSELKGKYRNLDKLLFAETNTSWAVENTDKTYSVGKDTENNVAKGETQKLKVQRASKEDETSWKRRNKRTHSEDKKPIEFKILRPRRNNKNKKVVKFFEVGSNESLKSDYVDHFTFKMSDYNIWSRANNA